MKKILGVVTATVASLGAGSVYAHSNHSEQHCREYTRTIYVGNQPQEGVGEACLQADGSWRIMNEAQVRDVQPPSHSHTTERVIVREPVYTTTHYSSGYYPRSGISISIGKDWGKARHHPGWKRKYRKLRSHHHGHVWDWKMRRHFRHHCRFVGGCSRKPYHHYY